MSARAVANVSYLRPAGGGDRPSQRLHRRPTAKTRRSGPMRPAVLLALLLLALIVGAVVALLTSSASLSADSHALARVDMPFGGGSIQRVLVTRAPSNEPVRVELRGDQIWPRGVIRAGQRLSIDVVVKRPGSISWLTGSTERVRRDLTTPAAAVKTPFVTLRSGQPLGVRFTQAVQVVSYGQPGAMHHHTLASPRTRWSCPDRARLDRCRWRARPARGRARRRRPSAGFPPAHSRQAPSRAQRRDRRSVRRRRSR